MSNEQKKVFLIDANNIIYRSFFAIKKFTTSTGQPTNAIYGFVSTLLKILKDYKPAYMAVVFDAPGKTIRHTLLEQYKITRKPMPPELHAQFPVIKEIIQAFRIKILQQDGYEADDLLASLALKLSEDDFDIVIITGDKDILQLLSKKITVLNPATWKMIDENTFQEKYGFIPASIVDYLALTGDASDSIPGVRGIGEKTATELIKKFTNIENLYENIENIKGKTQKILIAGKDSALLSKKLVLLSSNILLEITQEHLKITSPDISKIKEIFQNLEFRKFENYISEIFPDTEVEIKDVFAIGESIFDFNYIIKNPHQFKQKLEDKNILKVGKDLKEKIKQLASKDIYLSQPYFDISIASFLIGKSIPDYDILQAYRKYREELAKQEMEFLFDSIEIPLIEVIASMETNGILVDTDYLKSLKLQYKEEMNDLQEKIFLLAGEVFNINSPAQVGKILFEHLGLPSKRKTKTGYSTDTGVLEKIRDKHKIVDLILRYRELSKLCSTYLDGFYQYINPQDVRIHPEFLQTGVSSGRLSCRNPNLQAIPVKTEKGGKIRKIFVAPENSLLYSFDYNQIELRVLAHFSKDPVLCDAFHSGRDIHLETAKHLFSFESDSLFSSEEQTERYRRIAKTINFGIIYGMNEYGLAQRLSCTPEEAQAFIESYFAKFQGVRKYIHQSISEAENLGYVKTLFGRKRYLSEIHSENKSQKEFACRVAVNMPIQGTSAELIKLAMIEIHKLIKSSRLKSKMILQVHDELLFEIYEREEDIVEKIKTIMENIYTLNIPLKIDIQKGKNYLEMERI